MSDSPALSLDHLPPLREIINAHDLRAEKSLGQNFLLDGNITDKIVAYTRDYLTPATTVFEIGPGPGGLTRSLLRGHAGRVVAIEFDVRAINALQSLKEAANGRLDLIHGDALKSDIRALSDAPRAVIANLPYNIATPLLIGWLGILAERSCGCALEGRETGDSQQEMPIDIMALMFQKEVAERIIAAPNSKAYGRLSVICQWLCHVQKIYDLPPSAFTPPPKVTSSVVRFLPKQCSGLQPSFRSVEKITAAAFNQRRKMIRASLKEYMPHIDSLGLDPTLRAENLSVADYIALACSVEKSAQ